MTLVNSLPPDTYAMVTASASGAAAASGAACRTQWSLRAV
jgi:hypothetical protein